MKKAISFLICISFLFLQSSFALDEIIQDDFAHNSLDKNLKIKNVQIPRFEDEFALNSLDKNLKVNLLSYPPVDDENLRYLDKNLKIKTLDTNIAFVDNLNSGVVKIVPAKFYSTKNNLNEGDFVIFKLANDTKIENTIYKKDSNVKARVETVMKNGIYGAPAEAVLDNFTLEDNYKLSGHLEKRGADRALWVYPCVYLLSWCFGAGLLFIPIRGGHVKFKPNKVYEIDI